MSTLKEKFRAEALERRSRLTESFREQAADDLAAWMASSPFRLEYDVTVAAYIPVGAEPGSLAMLDALAARRVTVLVPVVPDGPPAALDWAHYSGPGSLEPGRFGLLEPIGDRLGVAAIRSASVILVPAVSLDRTGVRLGRGAGYYDRTLHGLDAELVGVVYDDELVDSLPAGQHDVPMGWALTPGGGFVELS